MRTTFLLTSLLAVALLTLLSASKAEAVAPANYGRALNPYPVVPVYNNPYQNMVARQVAIQQIYLLRQQYILQQQLAYQQYLYQLRYGPYIGGGGGGSSGCGNGGGDGGGSGGDD